MTLHPIPLNFLIYEENFIFLFISAARTGEHVRLLQLVNRKNKKYVGGRWRLHMVCLYGSKNRLTFPILYFIFIQFLRCMRLWVGRALGGRGVAPKLSLAIRRLPSQTKKEKGKWLGHPAIQQFKSAPFAIVYCSSIALLFGFLQCALSCTLRASSMCGKQ